MRIKIENYFSVSTNAALKAISRNIFNKYFLLNIALLLCFNVTQAQTIYNPSNTPGYDSTKASTIVGTLLGVAFTTDSADYHPGSTVQFKGSGFFPNETVTIQVSFRDTIPAYGPAYYPFTVTCDSVGAFKASWYVDAQNLGRQLQATAVGRTSGYSSLVLFTDDTPTSSCYFAPDATYTSFPANDDGSLGPINLGFNFNLYGTNYTQAWINNNGNITFTGASGTYSSTGFPSNVPMVAGFWADVDTRGTGSSVVKYKLEAHRLVVTFPGVGFYNAQYNLLNTFQIIISDGTDASIGIGNNVGFNYSDMQWTTGSASGGAAGFGGTPATVGISKGNGVDYVQVGRFGLNSSVYDGGGGNTDGVNYLDNQCFRFNVSSVTNQPPSVSGVPTNNTVTVTCGSTSTFNLTFLPPEIAQTVTTAINTGGLCNTTTSTTSGSTSVATVTVTGASCNLGSHVISFTATDNFNPTPASTTVNITVNVVAATTTASSNAPICSGTTLNLQTPSLGSGTTYSWSGPNGFTSTLQNPTVSNATTAANGTYTVTATTSGGCIVTGSTVVVVNATSASTTNASICLGTSYTFNGTAYTTAGTYIAHLTNAAGCDSAATLNLTVKATSVSTTNISICPTSLPYVWNGLTFNAAGTQTAHLTNAAGCDSAATLNLTVKATSASTTNISICPTGLPYVWNGLTFNTAGTQTAHLTNAAGCDSAATLVLYILNPTSSTNSLSICSNALPFIWNGLTFTGSGTQTAHILNVAGCDSAATLILTVKQPPISTTNATICNGSSYMFNGTVYIAAGTYTALLTSNSGCDSIATLNLTVAPKPNAGADKIIGFNNGNASVTLSGVGSGVWMEQSGNNGSSIIVSPTSANSVVNNFSAIGTYNYIYVYGACTDTMKVTVNPNGNINSFVWVDTNEDGINNESGTNGINNVTVALYKDDGTGNFALSQTTVTATYNGMPGYYNFIVPETGNYKVKFPLLAQDGGLTTQNLSPNYSKTSVADPATGFSPVVAINTIGSGLDLNNTTIGAGYKYVAAPNCNMTATIGINQVSQCVTNNQYNFAGNFSGGTAPFTYLWDLNDGTSDSTQNVTHSYAVAGAHDVTFIVKDSRGCEAHASTVQINIGAKPKASLDIYTHSGNGDGFTFVSTSTISGGWMNYAWDLGNGTTSTLVNPMTTYTPGTYTISFIVTGNFGCSDTVTKVITIDSNNNYCSAPIANFSINNNSQCLAGNAFTFTNNSNGTPTNYDWNFGDGTALVTTPNAIYSYANSGTYNVALTVANACGSNTVTKQITVNDVPPIPAIITGSNTVTIRSVMLLSNVTSGGVWSSANTSVATINSFGIVTGINVGTTDIIYSVSNACGTSSVNLPITVTPIAAACTLPAANFSINNATQCLSGNMFVFANNSTGTALNYTWNFGDASSVVNTAVATHSYTSSNTYTISLTAFNNCGSSTITKTVTVNSAPAQTAAITGATAIITGTTSTLSSATTGGVWLSSNVAVASVDANGLVSAISVGNTVITYTVNNPCGVSTATKTITVIAACVPTSSITTASICSGNAYNFNGTFYTTAGTYTAHLTNAAGCDSTASLVLTVNQPTSSTTTASICAGSSYNFNGNNYSTSGSFTAHLTNAVGCDSAATLVLTVASLPSPLSAISGNTSFSVGSIGSLYNTTSGGVWLSTNTNIASINAATGLVTAINTGTTTITYSVTNACGNTVSVSTIVTVTAAVIPCHVNANFTVNNLQQCVTDNHFVFTNTTTGGSAPYTYLWNISDGSTATTKDFDKVFIAYDEHDVHLKVIDANGCSVDAPSQHIIIGAKPVANFTVLSNTGSGQSKTFISASTISAGNMSYLWDFGNGATSTLVNPTITFVQGNYTVKLVVSGIGTCKDSTMQTIAEQGIASVNVYPNPVVNTVQVSFKAASTTATTVKVMDLQGRILQTQTVMPSAIGTNMMATLDFSALQPGSYLIYISDVTNGFLATKTILKQ